jgi:hypothetical protein
MSALPLATFYQLGYVCRDVQQAAAMLTQRYGIGRMRFRSHSMMAQAHFYVGKVLFELIEPRKNAPQMYFDFLPKEQHQIRLQHQGFMVYDDDSWERINAEIDSRGIATDVRGAILDGNLRYVYADTLKELGHYTEYVYLTGPQRNLYYNDVPVN